MRVSKHSEAAFLAAMTASATHEVRNVLSIVKESAGLIGDMVRVSGRRGALDEEKVLRSLDRIEAQVKRGAELLTNLNRLSHSLDNDLVTVDLAQEVEQMVFRGQRFARTKGQRVMTREDGEGCPLRVNPMRLHMALFSAMETCLEALPEGSVVTVGTRSEGGARVVEYSGAPESGRDTGMPSKWEGWSELEELVGTLGANVERFGAGIGIRILFSQGTEG